MFSNIFCEALRKVDSALKTADKQKLTEISNEFKRMQQYMDNVTSQLDSFHKDVGFEFDGVFEPFKMARSILDHGLSSISNQLSGSGQNQTGGAQQGVSNPPSAALGPEKGYYNAPTQSTTTR